tara:strand:- start:383 stop:490 length:108 start_codon:yes stop_codon:yes gene_type:complete
MPKLFFSIEIFCAFGKGFKLTKKWQLEEIKKLKGA